MRQRQRDTKKNYTAESTRFAVKFIATRLHAKTIHRETTFFRDSCRKRSAEKVKRKRGRVKVEEERNEAKGKKEREKGKVEMG